MIAIEKKATVSADGALTVHSPDLQPGALVRVIVLVEEQQRGPKERKLKQDWAGALADLADRETSVGLQHKATEWRGDAV